MNHDDLVEKLNQEPFGPLRLYLTDGRTVEIFSRDEAMVSGISVYVFKIRRDRRSVADDTRLISLAHIVSVEEISPADRTK